MKFVMYAVAVVLAGWLILAAKELKLYLSAGWNNFTVEGMKDKESFLAEQERVHAVLYDGKKRWITYPRKLFLLKLLWICGDALAAATLHSAGLAPDDFVGVANLLTVSYLLISFMVYADFLFPYIQLNVVHKKEEYSVELLEKFYEVQKDMPERVMPVYVLFGFRVLRLVVGAAAILSVFYTA